MSNAFVTVAMVLHVIDLARDRLLREVLHVIDSYGSSNNKATYYLKIAILRCCFESGLNLFLLIFGRWELAEMSRRFVLVGLLVIVQPGTVTQSEC